MTVTIIYLLLGISCVLFFGCSINPSVNLNWQGLEWGQGPNSPWWVLSLNYLVVVFPAVASVSVYPLICVTLGNNLAFTYEHLGYSTRVWRLVASVIPLIMACLVSDLSLILQVAGLPGVWIAFVTPLWLFRKSLHVDQHKATAALQTTAQPSYRYKPTLIKDAPLYLTQTTSSSSYGLNQPSSSREYNPDSSDSEYLVHFKTPWLRTPALSVAVGVFGLLVVLAVVAQLTMSVMKATMTNTVGNA